jgi:hypothetical protein
MRNYQPTDEGKMSKKIPGGISQASGTGEPDDASFAHSWSSVKTRILSIRTRTRFGRFRIVDVALGLVAGKALDLVADTVLDPVADRALDPVAGTDRVLVEGVSAADTGMCLGWRAVRQL